MATAKSTRAGRGRSVLPSPTPLTRSTSRQGAASPRHQPPRSNLSKLRPPAEVISGAKRTLAAGSSKKLRIGSTLAVFLRKIHERLEAALSVTSLCVIALKAQAADHDIDVALCLECSVEQVIADEMEHIENVLKGASS